MSDWLELIKKAGVVGAGGAGFPTHVKLQSSVDTVLINAAECEPLLYADQHLLAHESETLFEGLLLLCEKIQPQQLIIGAKNKAKKYLTHLEKRIQKQGNKRISISLVGDNYPAGDEQILIYEILGRIVPPGGLPLQVGCVVLNVETLFNIHNALQGQPVVDTYITVAGAVQHPCTVKVPIGTKVQEILNLAGGVTLENYAILDGGPVMGFLVEADSPVKKTTKGLVVLPAEHPLITRRQQTWETIAKQSTYACIECRMCTDTCPRYLIGHPLEPHKLMRALGSGPPDTQKWLAMAKLCCECGVCDLFACPHDLSPRFVNHYLKGQVEPTRKPVVPPDLEAHPFRPMKQVPTVRLIQRLELKEWDIPAEWNTTVLEPRKVNIPLRQHIGTPAHPRINIGDRVERGQLIAAPPADSLGASIHAGIGGKVTQITEVIQIEC